MGLGNYWVVAVSQEVHRGEIRDYGDTKVFGPFYYQREALRWMEDEINRPIVKSMHYHFFLANQSCHLTGSSVDERRVGHPCNFGYMEFVPMHKVVSPWHTIRHENYHRNKRSKVKWPERNWEPIINEYPLGG